MSVLIIAEAGVNHNANFKMAKDLIDAAFESGADIVKFQTAVPEEVVTAFADKANYQKETTGSDESQLEMTRRIHLPFDAFSELSIYCQQLGMEFLTTSFGPISTDFIGGLNLKRFKIPSGEITNLSYLTHIASFGKPVLLSTGMANLGEVEMAIAVLEQGGISRSDLTLLHCNTEYPTPMNDVNLRAMISMGAAFKVKFGYSDHTLGAEVAVAAVAMGASVIEKHLTLNRNLPGPDHRASLEPLEFKQMVNYIRNIEIALGDGIKKPSESEKNNIPVARKSLVAIKKIYKGEYFSNLNIGSKRPGNGLSPMLAPQVIGRIATRDFEPDEQIEI